MSIRVGHESRNAYGLARQILARFGVDIADASRPADSQSNEVWLTSEVVLRMGRGGDGYLIREAKLAEILPPDVGYPPILGSGVLDGVDWIVAERLPGINMGEIWAAMDDEARVRAVANLWQRLAAVHRTDVARARQLGCTSTPFYALDLSVAAAQLRWLVDQDAIDRDLTVRIERILAGLFAAITDVPWVLAHTDVHPGNAIWDGSRATLLDFEFACVGPVDLDLDFLFRSFLETPISAAGSYLLTLAQQDLMRPRAKKRIVGYAVLRELSALNAWLRMTPNRDALETWVPWRNLRGHAYGTSWLEQIWA